MSLRRDLTAAGRRESVEDAARHQGLGPVTEGVLRIGVDFDHQAVRPRRQGCQGNGVYEVPASGGVTRVDDDGQVGKILHGRHRGNVDHVAGERFEGPDAPLAEDDVGVAVADDILRGKKKILDGRRETPFEHDRLVQHADFLQEAEVLHVARPYLDDVGVTVEKLASLGSMISVTTGRPVSSRASAR